MADINYKMKYQSLKGKFMSSVDMAFRLGYEAGAKDAQVEQAAQAQQQAAEQEAQMGQDPQGGSEGGWQGEEVSQADPSSSPNAPGAESAGGAPMQESEHPDGSELDQHINMLESMLAKGEEAVDSQDLRKALDQIKSFKQAAVAKKNIKGIAKALKKPVAKKVFALGKGAQNLSPVQKNALSMQESIVSDIMKSWEKEEQTASKSILETLKIEGLAKKE